jgi:hypothetical protein
VHPELSQNVQVQRRIKLVYMINRKFMKLCTLEDHNMKICTLVGYLGTLRFNPVMLLWTYINFETTQYALCPRKFAYMINQKFMKLCSLKVHPELSQNVQVQRRITGVNSNGPRCLINVHIFILVSCNEQSHCHRKFSYMIN